MFNLLDTIRFFRIELRRKKSKKKGGKLKLKLGNCSGFFAELHKSNIDYVVLRWFDEVPLTKLEEENMKKDIDILFHHSDLKKVIKIAVKFPGKVLAEFYSVEGKKGTAARGYPYYPPVLAEKILQSRVLHKNSFYIPASFEHFQSLLYHIVYHKGYESGLPVDASTAPQQEGKRDYLKTLTSMSQQLDIELPEPITLFSLHDYLNKTGWTMPYDLKLRWNNQQKWLKTLCKKEENLDFTYASQLPELIVFLIRSDATVSANIKQSTIDKIESRFNILQTIDLDKEAQQRVSLNVRGGNWIEHSGKIFTPALTAVICHDSDPIKLKKSDPRYRKNPHITNAKVLDKNIIRDEINILFPDDKYNRTVLHSSDNTMEAHHHLLYVCGRENYAAICEELTTQVSLLNS